MKYLFNVLFLGFGGIPCSKIGFMTKKNLEMYLAYFQYYIHTALIPYITLKLLVVMPDFIAFAPSTSIALWLDKSHAPDLPEHSVLQHIHSKVG